MLFFKKLFSPGHHLPRVVFIAIAAIPLMPLALADQISTTVDKQQTKGTASSGNDSVPLTEGPAKSSEITKEELATAVLNAEAEAKAEAVIRQRAEAEADSHYTLAYHYASRLDLELADVEFEQAILRMPTMRVFHRDYCLFCMGRLNLAKALAEFMLATGLGVPVPYTPFEKAELDARAAKLHYRKALSYGRANRWPPAITELKWAMLYGPTNSAIQRSLAFAYASAGQFELAEKQYSESLESAPNDAYSHADFAFLLSQEGKQDKAINQISRAVELQPEVAALHIDLAWLAEKNGDVAKASQELQEAVKLSPKHAILWVHLGRLLEKSGDLKAARKAYSQALSLDPQLAEAKSGLSKLKI